MGKAAGALKKKSARLRALPGEGVTEAVGTVRKAVMPRAKKDTGGNLLLSGLKNGRAFTIDVKRSGGTVVTAEIKAGPRGQRAPWFWLNEGTNPHTTHGGTRPHPGTPAKRTWDDPIEQARAKIKTDFENRFRSAIKG
jgi:hypothetical protein